MPNRYSPDEWLGTMPYPPPEMPPELQTVIPGAQQPMPQQYADPMSGLSQYYPGGPEFIDPRNVPQIPVSAQLQSMMNGEGYDPATMAAMRAGTIEDISNAALPQMAGTRRALGQAGLTNSPAGQAYLANIGRQTGDKQASGLHQLNVSNAMLGMENKKWGLNQAHLLAVENMNKMFEAMGQNLQQSGANLRTGAQIAFNQNPFQPSAGQPKQSAAGAALTGAGEFIDAFGNKKPKDIPINPSERGWPSPTDIPGGIQEAPMQVGGVAQDRAFSKNPFKGY